MKRERLSKRTKKQKKKKNNVKERDQIKISKLNEVEIYFTSRSRPAITVVMLANALQAHFLDFVLCSSFIIRHEERCCVDAFATARPHFIPLSRSISFSFYSSSFLLCVVFFLPILNAYTLFTSLLLYLRLIQLNKMKWNENE